MLRCMLKAKIHMATVTESNLEYEGSITIDENIQFIAERELAAAIRQSGYGLTLGVQTRLSSTWERAFHGTATGNTYVNRNMIGAVVGVQPFGGSGLSGTGPKAGGPHYLARFASERTLTINTTATGGNAALLRLS
jgi:RHH-type proline utilization regulon transcriptional repressor/proline dehydrogenase/delta 1-pyrroline-5-carboxylate dehydrogenase